MKNIISDKYTGFAVELVSELLKCESGADCYCFDDHSEFTDILHDLKKLKKEYVDLTADQQGYIPMDLAIVYYLETDEKKVLRLYFDLSDSKVLVVMSSAEEDEKVDREADIEKRFFKNRKKEELIDFSVIDKIKEALGICEVELSNGRSECIESLLNIITPRTMLVLLGNELLFRFYYVKAKKYGNMINILQTDNSIHEDAIKAVCQFVERLVWNNKPSDDNFINSADFTKKNWLAKASNLKDGAVYIYHNKNSVDKTEMDNYHAALKARLDNPQIDDKTKKKLKRLLKNSWFIIISKTKIGHKLITVPFECLDKDKFKSTKNNLKNIQSEIIGGFAKFLFDKNGYLMDEMNVQGIDDIDIEVDYHNTEKYISDHELLSNDMIKKYARIVSTLKDFFDFLNDKNYISKGEYDRYMDMVESIYKSESRKTEFDQQDTDRAEVFMDAVLDLYTNHDELFSREPEKEKPFIYRQKDEKLICSKEISVMFNFVAENADKTDHCELVNRYIKGIREEDMKTIKNQLLNDGRLKVNKNRAAYRIKDSEYFAVIAPGEESE